MDKTIVKRLGDMRITGQRGQAKTMVTTLTGRVRDQAELLGILNSLYDMHFSILLIKRLSDRTSGDTLSSFL
jgi:hypothetical protein